MSKTDSISVARIRELLNYDPTTGIFRWRADRSHNAKAGDEAGYVTKRGYRIIYVDGVQHKAHRLAFVLMVGRWPENLVDHINGNGGDNRWANLRDVTNTVNQQNRRKAQKNSHTGLMGVSSRHGKWFVRIAPPRGRRLFISGFESAELAHEFYLLMKEMLHPGYAQVNDLTALAVPRYYSE